MIWASLALFEGRREEAVALLEQNIQANVSVDMLMHAASSRWRLGILVGGARGEALIAEAKQFMTSQGIRNPVRILNMHTPGFPPVE